jgi:CBS domain-containing protein/PII-like signaling protein
MSNNQPIKRVRIYLNERDLVAGEPLYMAALACLRREGATGATALRGIAGFGPSHRLRTAGVGDFSPGPVVIEWVDRAERVLRVMPALDELLPDALITVEDVRVYRAVLRSSGPFGERTVGQAMAHEPATVQPGTLARGAAELMLERAQALLPVLDERGGLAGVLSAGDLARRSGLVLPLRLWPALGDAERQALLDRLPARTVADLMTAEPRTIYVESSIPQAISLLVEWGIGGLPVLDREGQLAGLFDVEQALRAALRAEDSAEDGSVRNAEPPTPVGLVMQRAVTTLAPDATLDAVASALLAAPDRFLIVVDAGKPLGGISDRSLIERLAEPFRSAWLNLLRAPGAPPQFAETENVPTAGQLAEASIPTIAEQAAQEQAIQIMLDGEHERLIVLDEQGRLAGLLARRGLLRALSQAAG